MLCFSKFQVLILLLIISICSGCGKNHPAGISSNIKIFAVDFKTQKPIPNVKLVIRAGDYKPMSGPLLYSSKIIDSAYTDSNGYCDLGFKTVSGYEGYQIAYYLPNNYYDGNSNNHQVIKVGKTDTLNIKAFKITNLKLSVAIIDNPANHLDVSTTMSSTKIFSDSTISLRANFGSETIYFRIPNKDTPTIFNLFDTTLYYEGDNDIFYKSITVYPSRFVKRG